MTSTKRAFTLIELLVVVAIIAILASLLVPAVGRTKASGRVARCVNLKRQVTLAWTLYSDDHDGALPQNPSENNLTLPWTQDFQTWFLWDITTNIDYLMSASRSCLANYSKNAEVYVCPEDHYVSAVQKAAGIRRRIRNVSMNFVMGPPKVRVQGAAAAGNLTLIFLISHLRRPQIASFLSMSIRTQFTRRVFLSMTILTVRLVSPTSQALFTMAAPL